MFLPSRWRGAAALASVAAVVAAASAACSDELLPCEGDGCPQVNADVNGPGGSDSADLTGLDPPQVLPAQRPVVLNSKIDTPMDYVTLLAGDQYEFRGQPTCPPKWGACSYLWEVNAVSQLSADGGVTAGPGKLQTSKNKDLGKVTFDQRGYYTVQYTVSDGKGRADPSPALQHVPVWDGTFSDHFKRSALVYGIDGWKRAVIENGWPPDQSLWTITTSSTAAACAGGCLTVIGAYRAPGSTALVSWPTALNVNAEATFIRTQGEGVEHYGDIILRMNPTTPTQSFYRVRIFEERDTEGSGIQIAIFKIFDPFDQHGVLLNDPTQARSRRPTVCNFKPMEAEPNIGTRNDPTGRYGCPYSGNFPRAAGHDIRLVAWLEGVRFTAIAYDTADPDKPVLVSHAIDDYGNPFIDPGFVGLAQYEGVGYITNFFVCDLDKRGISTPPCPPVPADLP